VKVLRSGLAALLAAAVLLPAALGGEEPAKKEPPLDENLVKRLPAALGRADLVALVKVTEVGEAKPPGEGLEGDEAGLAQLFGLPNMWDKIRKRQVAVEVEECLKGEKDYKDLKTLKFRVFTSTTTGKELSLVVSGAKEMSETTPFKAHYRKPSFPFTLAKGARGIVFLKAAEKKDEAGKVLERSWSPAGPLMGPEADRLVAAVRALEKQVAEWEKLPKLSAEDEAAVRKLVADLFNADFQVRAAAAKALSEKGGLEKPLVEVALAGGPDAKAEDRVERILGAGKLAAAVRELLKQMAEWGNPPKLSPEDEAAVRKLIGDLSAADFQAREAATKALSARGRAVRALLEAALKASEDPEVKNRAEQILDGLRPPALKLEAVAGLLPVLATE
jgi:hypothetical protein